MTVKWVCRACVKAGEWHEGSRVLPGESGQKPLVCGTEGEKGISYLQKSVKCYATCSQGYLLMLLKQVK